MPTNLRRTGCGSGRSIFTARSKSTAPYSPQECPPPCPACGAVDCFCRPRFFAGQLLTDEDLSRLEHYVVEKNKLHNRYLHGFGIVCGLDVMCDPCDPQGVVVQTGYALSPCGDDIVVCKDVPVNICDLINECCTVGQPDCDPIQGTPGRSSPPRGGDWVLAICYDEVPSRGIAALRADVHAASCSPCACGGASSCGCGGHSKGHQHKAPSQHKKRLPQCEPTLTCETYKFKVYREQDRLIPLKKAGEGLTKDLAYIASRLPQPPSENAALSAWTAYGNNYRDVVWGFLAEDMCVSEQDRRRLAALASPDLALFNNDRAKYIAATKEYVGNVTVSLMSHVAAKICNALKLPCPGPIERNCVPLARITVGQPDCSVLDICEVSVREYVLSAVLERLYGPLRAAIRRILDVVCCDRIRGLPPGVLGTRIGQRIGTLDNSAREDVLKALEGRGAKPLEGRELLGSAFADRARQVDVETLTLALLGARDTSGNPFARPEELADPSAFLFASQVLRPAMEAVLPKSWTGMLGLASRIGGAGITNIPSAPPGSQLTEELSKVKEAVRSLKKETKTHKATIAELKRRLDKP